MHSGLIRFPRPDGDIVFEHRPAPYPGAPLAVLWHGFPGDASDWEPQLPALAGEYELIVPYAPGTLDGQPAKRARLALSRLVEDTMAMVTWADPIGERPLFLIGHDLGCFINAAFAERFPEGVQGMVHLNGLGLRQYFHRLFGLRQWLRSSYVLLVQLPFFPRFVRALWPRFFRQFIYRLCGVDAGDSFFDRDARVLAPIAIYRVLFREVWRFFGQAIPKLAVPTLFVWGNQDRFLEIPRQSEVNRFYRHAEVRILSGGHWVSRSRSAEVNRILLRALKEGLA